MARFQSFPDLWLLSDARNDAVLEDALARLPRGSGFIYRHYHLSPRDRLQRFRHLARIARARELVVILSDDAKTAAAWGADGIYGAPLSLGPRRDGLLRLATVHSLDEMRQANAVSADAALVSPVFATRSHEGAEPLGPLRFHSIARNARMPVIALGGMTAANASRLGWNRWAAIDGLS